MIRFSAKWQTEAGQVQRMLDTKVYSDAIFKPSEHRRDSFISWDLEARFGYQRPLASRDTLLLLYAGVFYNVCNKN